MLEALVAALPHLLLSADETSNSDTGMQPQYSSSVGQLVTMVLGACSTAGLPGMLCVLRLPAMLAPHMEVLLARNQVSPRLTCLQLYGGSSIVYFLANPDLNLDFRR